MENWSRIKVYEWLLKIGFGQYLKTFIQYGVDGEMLTYVTEEELKSELYMNNPSDRKKLLEEISRRSKLNSWIYSAGTRKGLSIYGIKSINSGMFPFDPQISTNFSSPIRIKDTVYIIGGQDDNNHIPLDQTLEITINFTQKRCIVAKKAPMKCARSCASLCSIDNKVIYAAGGYAVAREPFGSTTACEKYIIEKDKWNTIAPLSEPKSQISLCPCGSNLYCFGGSNFYPDSKYTLRVEYLNINEDTNEWIVVKLSDPLNIWTFRRSALTAKISPYEILIYGGAKQSEQFRQALIFNTITKEIKPGTELVDSANFEYAEPHILGTEVYSVDTSYKVHIFSILSKRWKVIHKSKAFPHIPEDVGIGDLMEYINYVQGGNHRVAEPENPANPTLGVESISANIENKGHWLYHYHSRHSLGVYRINTEESVNMVYTRRITNSFMSSTRIGDVIIFFGGEAGNNVMQQNTLCIVLDFNTSVANVFDKAPMPTARSCSAAASYHNHAYVAGGYGTNVPPFPTTGVFERYSIVTDAWSQLRDMIQPRALPGKCVLDHFFYVFGGANFWPNAVLISSIERFDFENEEVGWTRVEIQDPLGLWSPIQGSIVEAISDTNILICGGRTDGPNKNAVYLFDAQENTLIDLEHRLDKVSKGEHGSTYMHNNHLYAIDNDGILHVCDLDHFNWEARDIS